MKARAIVIAILLLAMITAVSACKPRQSTTGTNGGASGKSATSSEVTLQTSDGFTLSGTFMETAGSSPFPACLLVHEVGKDRTVYAELQQKLSDAGIDSLAIDLRGHGKSNAGGSIDYHNFSEDQQWVAMSADLAAGLAWLRAQPSVDKTRIGIVGASIGANLAVITAADDMIGGAEPPVACLALLSPGLNYHGVQPNFRGHDLGHIPVLIYSGTSDAQSYSGSQSLSQAARSGELRSFNGQAHGTDLFGADPNILPDVVTWIKANIIPREREIEAPASTQNPSSQPEPPMPGHTNPGGGA